MESKHIYSSLAVHNIKENTKTYLPYILTCILNIAMFYIVCSLAGNEKIDDMIGANTVRYFLQFGVFVIALFSFVVLYYTNNFLMKRRLKEFGLYQVLGMEKRHILRIIRYETIIIGCISLVVGLFFGMLFDKVMYLIIGRMFKIKSVLGFYISTRAMMVTGILFIFIFTMMFFKSKRQLKKMSSVDLLKGSSVGEREPKTKWVTTILGLISLGTGYYIAVTTKNPLTAIILFFVAVILVIIGTYLLFTSGSIALLKTLQKNKHYFYQSKHFISISGMIYRMRQNAIGLANICILSTMIVVMLSSTISLWTGTEDMIKGRYPNEFGMTMLNPSKEVENKIETSIREVLEEKNVVNTNELAYHYLIFSAYSDKDQYSLERPDISQIDQAVNLFIIPLDDYNKLANRDITLDQNEVLFYMNRGSYNYDKMNLFDQSYTIKEKLNEFMGNGTAESNITTTQYIVVKDETILKQLYDQQKAYYGDVASDIMYYTGFDTDLTESQTIDLYDSLKTSIQDEGISFENRTIERNSFMGLFAGLLFLGIFLSVLFIVATILIIYYKQISEGYEDKERFKIMQNIGMSQKLVKKAIRSQVLTVFLLPPVVAGIHMVFAFPFILKVLQLFGLNNTILFMICTFICFAIFFIIYIVVYLLTAKTYYQIVKTES